MWTRRMLTFFQRHKMLCVQYDLTLGSKWAISLSEYLWYQLWPRVRHHGYHTRCTSHQTIHRCLLHRGVIFHFKPCLWSSLDEPGPSLFARHLENCWWIITSRITLVACVSLFSTIPCLVTLLYFNFFPSFWQPLVLHLHHNLHP